MRLFLFLTVKHSIAMMKALPEMFPSPVAPPKKLGHASEAMLHILQVRTMWMYESFSHYFTIQYKEWIVVVIFVFLFVFVSVCRRPQHLSSGETTLQPCCDCLWNQLHTGHWNYACADLSKRGHLCQRDVSHGMLLCLSPYIS